MFGKLLLVILLFCIHTLNIHVIVPHRSIFTTIMTTKRFFGLALMALILVYLAIVIAEEEDERDSNVRREHAG